VVSSGLTRGPTANHAANHQLRPKREDLTDEVFTEDLLLSSPKGVTVIALSRWPRVLSVPGGCCVPASPRLGHAGGWVGWSGGVDEVVERASAPPSGLGRLAVCGPVCVVGLAGFEGVDDAAVAGDVEGGEEQGDRG
jgi:hypothetical protein